MIQAVSMAITPGPLIYSYSHQFPLNHQNHKTQIQRRVHLVKILHPGQKAHYQRHVNKQASISNPLH